MIFHLVGSQLLLGLTLVVLAGICQGLFLAPLRFLKGWDWEHVWVIWSTVALLLGPVLVAAMSIPNAVEVYTSIGAPTLLLILLVGALAGTSGFLYSLTIPVIGLALATGLNSGSSMATGSVLPLLAGHLDLVVRPSGALILAGVAVSTAGMFWCAKGGSLRENKQEVRNEPSNRLSFVTSVVFCILAGAISSCLNLGLAFQNVLTDVARRSGASEFGVANAYLTPYLAGGFLSNAGYAGFLVLRRRSACRFLAPGWRACAMISVGMGIAFVVSIALYAAAVAMLGSLGPVVGWGVLTATTILSSATWDLLHGEWSGASRRLMNRGVALLIAAILLVAGGQYVAGRDGTRIASESSPGPERMAGSPSN